MPLEGCEQVEISLTIALTLFAVAALAWLKPERVGAAIVAGVVALQFIYPTTFIASLPLLSCSSLRSTFWSIGDAPYGRFIDLCSGRGAGG